MKKKKNQKLNKYSINIQNIRIDLTWSYRLRPHNTLSRPWSTISLLSMQITTDTINLSLANFCTHNKSTCMHLNISISKHGSYIIGSIKAIMLSAFHNFHAWKHENMIEILSINNKTYKKQALEVSKIMLWDKDDLHVLKGSCTAHHDKS